MSGENDETDKCECQEQNENCENNSEENTEKSKESSSSSRRKRAVIDGPNMTNRDANGRQAEEF